MRRVSVLVAALLALLALAPAAEGQGPSDEAIVVINGDVTVERGQVVEGVFIVDGDARIAGRVDGDVAIASGNATVAGRIDGNLVTISGQARLLPTASVGGDISYGDERPIVAPAATVEGTTEKEGWTDSVDLFPFIGAFILWLAIGVSSLLLGLLLLLIAPRAADAIAAQTRERIGVTIAIGFAIFIVLPLAAFLAAITLLGLPLAIGIGFALMPIAAVAYVTSAWALGRAILGPPRGRILAFLVGLAILRALALVPILGLLVGLAAIIFGLGLIGAAIGAARSGPEAAPAPAHSA
jgi:cytoskeletal protein CcmA (bactofilin family)